MTRKRRPPKQSQPKAWEIGRGLVNMPELIKEHARTMVKSGLRSAMLVGQSEKFTKWYIGEGEFVVLGD